MKAKPGQVSVATAGVNSSGHAAIEAFTRALGLTYKHVSYDGGNPAVIATVAGETEITTQLAVEQANMIRGKRLRPLAVLSDQPLELEGFGTIPPITSAIAGYKPDANYFGIFVPKNVPAPVLQTLDMVWKDVVMKSEALKKYAAANGALFAPAYGDDALKVAMPAIRSHGLAAAGERQGEGVAGHRRHSEAVSASRSRRSRRCTAMQWTKAISADRIGGLIWVAFGGAVVYGSWAMDRLQSLGIPPATAPGVVPGLLGIAFIIFGVILLVRREPASAPTQRKPPHPPSRRAGAWRTSSTGNAPRSAGHSA